MKVLSCPKCQTPAVRGTFGFLPFLIAVLLFPIGLLALLAGRNPTTCPSCGFSW